MTDRRWNNDPMIARIDGTATTRGGRTTKGRQRQGDEETMDDTVVVVRKRGALALARSVLYVYITITAFL